MAANADLAIKITTQDVDRAARDLHRLAGGFDTAKGSAIAFGAAAAAATAGLTAALAALTAAANAIPNMVNNTIKLGVETSKLQQLTGATAQEMSGLMHVVDDFGVSSETLGARLTILSRNIHGLQDDTAAAIEGGKGFRATMETLGVQFETATGQARPMMQVLMDVADRFHEAEDGIDKTAVAAALFGRGASDLIPTLNKGGAAIRELIKDGERLGTTIGEEDVEALLALHMAQDSLGEALEGLGNKITMGVMPVLTGMAAAAIYIADQIHEHVVPAFGTFMEAVGDNLATAGEFIQGFAEGATNAWTAIGNGFLDIIDGIASGADHLVNGVFGTSLRAIGALVQQGLSNLAQMITSFVNSIDISIGPVQFSGAGFAMSAPSIGDIASFAIPGLGAARLVGGAAGGVGEFFSGLGSAIRGGLPASRRAGGLGGGRPLTGRPGGGGGGGSKGAGAKEAEDIVAGFMEVLQRSEADVEAAFGKLGGKLAAAINEGIARPTTAQGRAIAGALEEVITDLRESGVEDWRQVGDELAGAVLKAIQERTPDVVAAAMEMLGSVSQLAKETRFWTEWAEAGEDAADKVNKAIIDGAKKMEEAWAKFHEAVKEAQDALADSRWLDAQRAVVDVIVEQQRKAGEEVERTTQRQIEDADRAIQRAQSREDIEEERRRALRNIRSTNRYTGIGPAVVNTGADPAAAINAAAKQQIADLEKREKREDDAIARRRGQEDAAAARRENEERRLYELRAQLEKQFGIDKETLENKALEKTIASLAKQRDEQIKAANDMITTAAETQRAQLDITWNKLIDKLNIMVGQSATIAANLGATPVGSPAGPSNPYTNLMNGTYGTDEGSSANESTGVGDYGGGDYGGDYAGDFATGGTVPRTGWAWVHKGETVTPAGQGATYVFNGDVYGDRDFWARVDRGIQNRHIRNVPVGR